MRKGLEGGKKGDKVQGEREGMQGGTGVGEKENWVIRGQGDRKKGAIKQGQGEGRVVLISPLLR